MTERMTRYRTLLALVLLCLVMSVASPHFASVENARNVLVQSSINAVVAAGMTFAILTGGIDLSVGSVLAFAGVVLGDVLHGGVPWPVAAFVGMLVGVVCGYWNGLLVTKGRLPPFIATLGMMSMARGLALVYCGGRPVSGYPREFMDLAHGSFFADAQGGGGLPVPVVIVALVYAGCWFLLEHTTFGRSVYALGGNEEAAWLSGIRTARIKTAVYALCGLLAGLGAVMLTARLNSASPTAGEMYELDAIAATVIGGTSLQGGTGGVLGTLVGALIMGVLRNGLNLLDVSSYIQQIIIGLVILVAVLMDPKRRG